MDAQTVLIIAGVLVVLTVASNLPLRRRPLGVVSTPEATVIRAHGWVLVPVAFLAACWWAGRAHVPGDPGMTAVLAGFTLVLAVVIWLAWRNCRAELSADRIVLRASYDGRRIGDVRRPVGRPAARLGLGPTRLWLRPRGLLLAMGQRGGDRWASARELLPVAGLLRGDTWAYRALREAARAGHWPSGTQLAVTHRLSRGQRRILAEIAELGVEVVEDAGDG